MNQCHYIRRTINDFPSVILKVSEICKNSSNVVLIEHSLQRQFSNTFNLYGNVCFDLVPFKKWQDNISLILLLKKLLTHQYHYVQVLRNP